MADRLSLVYFLVKLQIFDTYGLCLKSTTRHFNIFYFTAATIQQQQQSRQNVASNLDASLGKNYFIPSRTVTFDIWFTLACRFRRPQTAQSRSPSRAVFPTPSAESCRSFPSANHLVIITGAP